MNDATKAAVSRYLLGDGTWEGMGFSTKFPGKSGSVSHMFYVLRANRIPWSKELNHGRHVPLESLCGRWTVQLGTLRHMPRENTRICRNCLRSAGKLGL